ncbi:MAG: pilus assembly PilX family protein [Akkermansiaceae bacterium]
MSHLISSKAPRGFALVATVSMMVLMTLIAVGMLSLSTIEQRSSGGGANEADRMARANARMALMIALGELQKTAGPDQRVTATASIMGHANNGYASSTTAANGRKHWLGVWETNGYTPETPNTKTFVRWLVSGDEAALDAIADAGTTPGADDVLIFDGVDEASTVKIPKVEVATNSGNTSYYAYWVEDEGVKVDLAWDEGEFTEAQREQAARLSAVPGPDHGVLDGPFSTGLSYPLKEASNTWLDNLKKATSPADMPLVMGSATSQAGWLQQHRHDIGFNSRGVLADVKKGGLRRDLSLAFEMDGDADFELGPRVGNTANYVWPDGELINPPTLFNLQDGEFVGGNDNLQALYPYAGMTFADNYAVQQTDARDGVTDGNGGLAPGMPVKERYLYRVTKNDGSPFSDQLKRFNYRHSHTPSHSWGPLFGWYPNSVVRGPNWWALRDFYNLYKRVTKSGSAYSLESRSYYPNNSAVRDNSTSLPRRNYRQFGQPAFPFATYHYDMESTQYGDMNFKPAKANYAPVYMGMIALYSMKVTNYNIGANAGLNQGDLTLAIDPIIYLWNPFNVTLKADRYALELQRGHGGKMSFIVVKPDGSEQKYGPAKTDIYIQKEAGGGGNLTYLVRNLVMEPGEVMILSPGAGTDNTALHDEATPGTNLTDDSGISTTWMPTTNWNGTQWVLQNWINGVKVGPGDTVRCLYDICLWHSGSNNMTNSAEHYWMATFMPYNENIKPMNLVNADRNTANVIYADRVQQVGGNFASRIDWGFKEYFVPDLQNQLDGNGDIIGYPSTSWPAITLTNPPAEDSKFFFGVNSHILKPTNYTRVDGSAMPNRHAVEVFSQFNPFRTSTYVAGHRTNVLNESYSSLSTPGSVNTYIQEVGVQFPTASGQGDRGFWGESFHANGGSTSVPFIDLPRAPILSLVDFANANLSLRSEAAYKDVGNSHASIFTPGNTIYSGTGMSPGVITTSDNVWLINEALFDRYYLSGIAPEFDFSGSGGTYNDTGTLKATLDDFYGVTGASYEDAEANPSLEPYIPSNKTQEEVVADLNPNDAQYNTTTNIYDGYKKLGAYSLVKGAFNVNSTSVKAWAALLRANRNLALKDVSDNSQAGTGAPFSSLKTPVTDSGSDTGWDGFSRLTDDQIWDDNNTPNDLTDDSGLAVNIVDQVRARGPFMSISDFVNRQVSSNTALNASGAIQSALDALGATTSAKTSAGGLVPHDPAINGWGGYQILMGDANLTDRRTTEGIAVDIRQADVLRQLAPRLSARTDTFRIRGYGEVADADGNIIAKSTCEAVVQRLPEYVDPTTDGGNNEPWDDDSKGVILNAINQTYGRRFEIRSFRWLDDGEV